jgi:enterochelin esterase family protein
MASFVTHVLETVCYPKLNHFNIYNLQLTSVKLARNPLGDPTLRNNPVLSPKAAVGKKLGLVFVLAGFAGNGTKYLADKAFEESFLQQLDNLLGHGKAPSAHYVFVDAWTFWGGSQFLNSKGTGAYEDYIVKELYPVLFAELLISPGKVAVVGQSSGGFGALHLASTYPKLFPFCGAFAPDCLFAASLLPDLYKAAPYLLKNNKYADLKTLHQKRLILRQKNGFAIINTIAMAACYSPSTVNKSLDWPIDLKSGEPITATWNRWLAKDPVHFLKKRISKVRQLKGLFLEVGVRDEFHLQFGVRQIHNWLKTSKVRHAYSEFEGGHFDFHDRYPFFWTWLKKQW